MGASSLQVLFTRYEASNASSDEPAWVFFFQYGVVVWWGQVRVHQGAVFFFLLPAAICHPLGGGGCSLCANGHYSPAPVRGPSDSWGKLMLLASGHFLRFWMMLGG